MFIWKNMHLAYNTCRDVNTYEVWQEKWFWKWTPRVARTTKYPPSLNGLVQRLSPEICSKRLLTNFSFVLIAICIHSPMLWTTWDCVQYFNLSWKHKGFFCCCFVFFLPQIKGTCQTLKANLIEIFPNIWLADCGKFWNNPQGRSPTHMKEERVG